MNIGITVFGSAPDFPINSIIAEYKQFIESNSQLRLNITFNQYPLLPTSEIAKWGENCYFVSSDSLSSTTKALIPSNTDVNIIAWDNQNLPICYGGGTWGRGVHGISFISIPFGWAPDTPYGLWQHSYAHERLHIL